MISRFFHLPAILLTAAMLIASPSIFADTAPQPEGKPQTGLRTIMLKVGSQNVRADIANTEASRQIGMMFRKKMGGLEGMLFVFPEIGYHAMWMRNTLIPLSVAYLNDSGTILSIHEMEPLSDMPHQSAGPARFALEMNAGWFKSNKISVGDTIKGLDKAPKPQ